MNRDNHLPASIHAFAGSDHQDWHVRFKLLWQALVPASGYAPTLQGEVLRLSGRVWKSVYLHDGANWDSAGCARMLERLEQLLAGGRRLPDFAEFSRLNQAAAARSSDHTVYDRICRLALEWVELNPELQSIAYTESSLKSGWFGRIRRWFGY